MKRIDYSKYKTDEERLTVVHSIPFYDWSVASDWEDEAKTEEAKSIFHSVAVSLYHKEEASCGML